MKFLKTILWLCFFIFSSRVLATDINGVLTADTLKLADSPFVAIGNLSVVIGDTVVIEPGVVIKFNAGLTFTINGTLLATGTVSDSIKFTSNAGTPNTGDWGGITFPSGGKGVLQFAVFEFAASGVIATGASPTISRSGFRQNNNGVDCSSSAAPAITSNKFTGHSNAAIRCNNSSPVISKNEMFNNVAVSSIILCENSSAPQISENLIYNNGNAGIDCSSGSNAKIWQNTIYGNDFGITISDNSAPLIKSNIIVGHENIGIAINDAEAAPAIEYNDVWSNTGANFFGASSDVGNITTTNFNSDASDIFFNISLEPKFVNAGGNNFDLLNTSPCLEAADPANPAGVVLSGARPDIGALEYNGSVPVELISFVFEDNKLRWVTASESNNFGFEIQRSARADGEFIRVGFVPGVGASVSVNSYFFKDEVNSGEYFYRLKQIDTDGTFSFSAVLKAAYSFPDNFSLAQNYPNPFNPATTISFEISEQSEDAVFLVIYDVLGREIKTLLNERKSPGFYKLKWNGDDKLGRQVASGIYFYKLRFRDEVIVRRMQLIR